jgi:cytochrome c oxidase subunit 3
MNALSPNILLKDTRHERDDPPGDPWPLPAAGSHHPHTATSSTSIGLWLFIGVATALFSLFIASYVMRMNAKDWYPIEMPRQLWLSTSLLVIASLALQSASAAARDWEWPRMRTLLLAGGVCTFLFLGAQLWAWQALLANRVMLAGNPAGSFFYLLTAMHGLHVIGGLVAWAATMYRVRNVPYAAPRTQAIALCARYWHFLLIVWVVLFATMSGLTPDIVRAICGTN